MNRLTACCVVLSNPTNAILGTSSATQTIVTDDVDANDAVLSISSAFLKFDEGSGVGDTPLPLTITRSSSVDWAIELNGSASRIGLVTPCAECDLTLRAVLWTR